MSQNQNGLIDPIQPNYHQITLLKTYHITQTLKSWQRSNHQIIKGKSYQSILINLRK